MRIPARSIGRGFLFRLPPGEDLYDGITAFCLKKKICFGTVSAIGAVSKATIGYYDQRKKKYVKKVFREELEMASCLGNISLKDGKSFLHLHATFGDTKLRAWSGHLFPGTTIFVAEISVTELKGKPLSRKLDQKAGLALWTCEA